MRFVAPVVALLVLIAAAAKAQTPGASLKGITRLQVLVESLVDADTECGLDSGSLDSWASKTLLDNNLLPVKDSNPYLYVAVTTLSFPSTRLCVSAVQVSVNGTFMVAGAHLASPALDGVSLISKSGIVSSVPANHPTRVKSQLTELTERIATEIRKASVQ